MIRSRTLTPFLLAALLLTGLAAVCAAGELPVFEIEIEGGGLWQTKNEVQIPNDETGTRFSLVDVAGEGPFPAARATLSWRFSDRQSLRALLAPLSITETGTPDEALDFAGASYAAGEPLEATYQFNSWRLAYRYRFRDTGSLKLWVGFTAKLRDAKVELSQGETTSKDTDLGFVPLLHLAADWRPAGDWHLVFDFDGLAGGPGRAFDVGLRLQRDFGEKIALGLGYRTVEGGADVESVYNFAWLNAAVLSATLRF